MMSPLTGADQPADALIVWAGLAVRSSLSIGFGGLTSGDRYVSSGINASRRDGTTIGRRATTVRNDSREVPVLVCSSRRGSLKVDMREVMLRRNAAVAAWWSLLGSLLTAAGVFFVVDTAGHPAAWATLVVFAVPAGYFLVQLVWPGAIEVRCGVDLLRSRFLTVRREVAWDEVHVAKVRGRFGDPVLLIEVRPADGQDRRVRVPLPVGADLERLHTFLRARLGRGSKLPAPRSLRPLDT